MIGTISIVTILGVSAAENGSTLSDINKIKDPYEQCLAYIKIKWITNVDCKTRVESMKQTQEPKKEERKDDHMMRGTGILSQSGVIQPRPPRPPIGSGAMMGIRNNLSEQEIKWLGLAMGKLKLEERMELMKMIRTYLESKGVRLPTPEIKKDENKKGWDGSIKWNSVTQENKKQQEAMKEFIKALQEKARQKTYTDHTALMK